MQGLAFWIGYQHRLFPNHDLVEGAVVAEFYRLLARHTDPSEVVIPECAYARIINGHPNDSNERADVVVALKGKQNPAELHRSKKKKITGVEFIMEVKRSGVPISMLKNDIRRLQACLNKSRKKARAFLLVVSQAGVPRSIRGFGSLINASGTASRRLPKTIEAETGLRVPVHIRRVCKATSSFDSKRHSSAHYVVLIEVLRTKDVS